MLPLCGRTHVPRTVCVRRGLNKLQGDRLELGRRVAGVLLGLIQQRVSGSVSSSSCCRGPLARAQCDSHGHGPKYIFRPQGTEQMGSPFAACPSVFAGSPQAGSLTAWVGRFFLFMHVWRGPAGDHRSTGMKHPGYISRPSDGSLPPSRQGAGFRPRQQSGENFVVFRVAPVSSVLKDLLKDSGVSRPLG